MFKPLRITKPSAAATGSSTAARSPSPATRVPGALVLLGLLAVAPAHGQPRDPTQPPRTTLAAIAEPAKAQAALTLDSILYGVDRRLAVINGEILAEGDRVAGAEILEISRDSVRISRGGSPSRLQLAKTPDIRRPEVTR